MVFSRGVRVLISVAVLAAVFLVGVETGERDAKEIEANHGIDLGLFWETWDILEARFVNTTGEPLPTPEERVWGAIDGLVRSYGDPNSTFLVPEEVDSFAEDALGAFGGVGMEIDVNEDGVVVIAPLKGTPAERAGLRSGDVIVAIDGEPTYDLNVDEAVNLIRGEIGTAVTLAVYRETDNNVFEVSVMRELISVPALSHELRADGVFVIQVFNFFGDVEYGFRDALRVFLESGSHKLILDLRGNPGGFLDASVDMTSWFLPIGTPIVREVSDVDEFVHRSKGYDIFDEQLRMVILVDNGSASASEILAGALQEYGIAELVGTQTFGKGSVQELIDLPGHTSLRLTIAKWLTPGGRSISEEGLEPDVVVERTSEDVAEGIDAQFETALELLEG